MQMVVLKKRRAKRVLRFSPKEAKNSRPERQKSLVVMLSVNYHTLKIRRSESTRKRILYQFLNLCLTKKINKLK